MRARQAIVLCLGLSGAALAMPSSAQMTTDDLAPTGPRNEDVARAVRWERLQTDVTYLRPSADFKPDESVRITVPDPEPTEEEARRQVQWTVGLVFLAILLGIAYVFAQFGNRIQVSFRGTSERRRREVAGSRRGEPARALPKEGFLERLAVMADRREALILLVSRALEQAAAANGLTLARAQTGRDVVRVVPPSWGHHDTLRRLVREAEIVHFGGRDLPEERWRDCLAAARPIFAGDGPA